ncbi:MAG: winged helix DNA-binding domain-containing protein [Actinobacteria bacterium]|nr:winged helix DNA-binding domain-containing protein [Actinomycetota bacterium]
MRSLSIDQARRYALAAQGLTDRRPSGRIDVRHFRRVLHRVGLVQLDSVNVFSRAHYMPFFSRLGAYERAALDRWLWRSGEQFEYWGHEASLIPIDQYPLWRWRMEAPWSWNRVERIKKEDPGYLSRVLDQVRADGPLQTRDLESPGQRDANSMWGWSKGKVALEALFHQGDITVFDRVNFVRLYGATEDVIRDSALSAAGLSREEGQRQLVEMASRSMGVASLADLADYHRIRVPDARPLVEGMVQEGRLIEVEVEGWGTQAFLHPDARLPREVDGRALLSPFDSLVWCRPRVDRLWDFHYRIEIYVPEAKRVHGYYVLPFLLDGVLVARVDLKTDRVREVLRVKGAWAEDGVDRVRVGRELRAELDSVALWLGMEDLEIVDNGDLTSFL